MTEARVFLQGNPSRDGYSTLSVLLGILAIVAVGGGLAGSYLLLSKEPASVSPSEAVILPTLELKPVELTSVDLSARIIGQKNGINIHHFTANEAKTGFSALGDEHILFTCPSDTSPGIRREVVHGDPYANTIIRYWGYEYSGRENENLEEHREGLALFDGRFYLSAKELEVSGDRYRYLQTENMAMLPSKRYYFMLDGGTAGADPFLISCIDTDRDGLTDSSEPSHTTNPLDADSDDDGFADGHELLMSLDPANIDTDGDGLQDGTEAGLTEGIPEGALFSMSEMRPLFTEKAFAQTPIGGTNLALFTPFIAGSMTITDPTTRDTDGDGIPDSADPTPAPAGFTFTIPVALVALTTFCGNGVCTPGEDPISCRIDCPPICGDGACTPGESCPRDCLLGACCSGAVCRRKVETWCSSPDTYVGGQCNPCGGVGFCGNTVCDPEEDGTSCDLDCAPSCGNDVCDSSENNTSCPADCGGGGSSSSAGNICDACASVNCTGGTLCFVQISGGIPHCAFAVPNDGTNVACEGMTDNLGCNSVHHMCYIDPGNLYSGSCSSDADCSGGFWGCNDGVCSPPETPTTCPSDCAPGATCGNRVCDAGEDPRSCPLDCGELCGNGTCDTNETMSSCPEDCRPCPAGTGC